ncbi:gamma carbonic anhydrase family protein [Pseudomonas sp. dw_612]|uniref:gamma carbonic anhydrase family protein n=1 Tax=Pseudomonas sp. dw_612 TaxID=2720080 RepID=UPI001BD603B9|nr:gamma carbonic anhydrase family protein [Pseudomonas sp. dw_612]
MTTYRFKGVTPRIHPDAYVFEDAVIIGDVHIEKNVSIWPGVTIRGDKAPIVIREGSNIQEHAVLHADPGYPLTIDKNVTVGHAVVLHGCTIGENSVIGIGAILLNGSSVPADSLVTAGSILSAGPRFVPGSMIAGSPAKRLVELSKSDIQNLRDTALEYQALANEYREGLERLPS